MRAVRAPRGSRSLLALALLAFGAVAGATSATAAAAAAAATTKLRFQSPDGKAPIFGEVDIELALDGADPVSELTLYVDGSLVARLAKPPFRVRYDVGQLNVEHQLVAEATTLFGAKLKATRTTPALEVDEQIEVELVQLFARVASTSGKPVRPLEASDFRVTDESGARLPLDTLAGGDVPISTVLLVDSSDSMKGEAFRQAVTGAQAATGLLGPADEVMVALFSDRLLRATDFTRDRQALESALVDVEARGGSAVYDHLYFALNRLRTRLGRPVVILFSDGQDVDSTLGADEVRWRARRSQATLYWVRLEAPGSADRRFQTFWKDEAACKRGAETLAAAVAESGGVIVPISTVTELSQALARIYADLRSQYVLGFHPGNRRHDGSWRPISVQADEPGTRTSARAGYVDD